MTRVLLAAQAEHPLNLGAGTVLPTGRPGGAPLVRGDVYEHTILGLHAYTGTAWRQVAPYPRTTAERTAMPSNVLYDGYEVYDTTLRVVYRWWAIPGVWFSDGARPRARLIPGSDGTAPNVGGGGGQGNRFARSTYQAVRWGAAPVLNDMSWSATQPTRLVCNVPGEYLVTGSAAFVTTPITPLGGRLALFRKNGVDIDGSAATMAPYPGFHAVVPLPATLIRLAKDDYIEMFAFHDLGAAGQMLDAPSATSGGQQASFQAVWSAA